MNPTRLLTDEDAVSPVIGVILMVAITAILAAVAGVFVLGFETGKQPVPSATFEAESGQVTIDTNTVGTDETVRVVVVRHRGGDALDPARLAMTVDGQPAYGVNTSTANDTARRLFDGTTDVTAAEERVVVAKHNSSGAGGPAAAVGAEYTTDGGRFTVSGPAEVSGLARGETIAITWTDREDERSARLFEHRVGSA
jgi:FlaG/FlaF family flagellin (archaellin)